jgi:hypothetical protein
MTEEQVYSAKQVASRIGTDAKTLRKFFRSSASPYNAVGQGGRYEFPAKDLEKIKTHFVAWQSGKGATKPSTPKPAPNGKATTKAKTRRTRHRDDVEPGEHRGLPYKPKPTKLNASEFPTERAARQAARDEEYGTVDGEEIKPTEEDLLEFEDIELELDDEDED